MHWKVGKVMSVVGRHGENQVLLLYGVGWASGPTSIVCVRIALTDFGDTAHLGLENIQHLTI
jgi:hypothetical protein